MAEGTCISDHLQDESSQSDDNDESQPESHALKTSTPLVNDYDASEISGIGRRSLHFLLIGQIRAKAGKRNVKKKSLKEINMPLLPAATASRPQAIRKKRLEEGIFAADDKDESDGDEFSVADEDSGRNALSVFLLNVETTEHI
jgi:hypothetical protein